MNDIQGLQLPASVDRLTLGQKAVGVAVGLGAGYLIVPFLLTLVTNILMLVLVGTPLLFLAVYWRAFFHLFVWIGDKFTLGVLSLDLLSAMDRYVAYLGDQKQVLLSAKSDLIAQVQANKEDLALREKAYKDNMERADAADELGNSVQRDIALSNAGDDKEYVSDMSPLLIEGEKHVQYLDDLIVLFDTNKQKIEYTVKAQKSKYKQLEAMRKSTGAAAAVIGGTSEQTKMWNKTNEMLKAKMNKMTADIKTFEDVLKPAIEGNRFDKQLRETQGRKLLEEFRKTSALPEAK